MAINITTLPSNIGGISVSNLTKGPLALLYGSTYDKAIYRYPKDLGTNPARKHSIVFTVREPDPQNLTAVLDSTVKDAGNIAEGVKNQAVQTAQQLASVATSSGTLKDKIEQGAAAGLNGISGAGQKISSTVNNLAKYLTKLNRRDGSTIGLYIPDTVNVAYQSDYDANFSLSSALGKPYFLAQGATSIANALRGQGDITLTNMINAAANDPFIREYVYGKIGSVSGMDLTRVGLNAGGYAVNPQLQVLFHGIGFRSFQFDFTFTPYSKEESDMVKNIISLFKYHSAPEINANGVFEQGMYMKVPDTFKINFYYGNEENLNVHRIGESVLTNINVDYAGSGQWTTFNDGSPSQIKMQLQFMETVIIDKNRILQGY